jgi:hypothetical protein
MSNGEELTPDGKISVAITAQNLRGAVELYWTALADFQNVLEDINGADGRQEYVWGLRLKLLIELHRMDAALGGHPTAMPGHMVAFVLDQGAPRLGLSAKEVQIAVQMDSSDNDLRLLAALGDFVEQVLARLPGRIPPAQSPNGQREVIRAMQAWSKIATARVEDLQFLAERLGDW